MKIVVTGGAGFIGSHLCRRLVREGNEVICLDNLYTGAKSNIDDLLCCGNFEFVWHDIINPIELKGVDQIYNLACPASPIHYQCNPTKTMETCVVGAINVLKLAKLNHAKVLQASTSEVYGDPLMHPQRESYWGNVNPIGKRSCYDEGKRAAETLFFDYFRQFGVRIKVARIFNTYGPYMQQEDGRVVSNFIIQALRGESISIYGDGKQTRSFCYISDLIEGLIRFMNSDDDFVGPINIGNPSEYTIIDLAEKVIKFSASKSKIKFMELPEDDPQKRRPDIMNAIRILGWMPTVSLEEGLLRTIQYFKKELQTGQS